MMWMISTFWPVFVFLLIVVIITVGRADDLNTKFTEWSENIDMSKYPDSRAAMEAYLQSLTPAQVADLPMPIDAIKQMLTDESSTVAADKTLFVERERSERVQVGTSTDANGVEHPIYEWVTEYPEEPVVLKYRDATYPHRLPWQLIYGLSCITDDSQAMAAQLAGALKPVYHWKTSYSQEKYKFIDVQRLPYTNYYFYNGVSVVSTTYQPVALLDYVECYDKIYKYNWTQVTKTERGKDWYRESREWKVSSVTTTDNSQRLLAVMNQNGLSRDDAEMLAEIIGSLPDGDEIAFELESTFAIISDYLDPGSAMGDLSNLTFKDGATQVVYYNQGDPRWARIPYGYTGTISSSGCGPTSMAIVISSLTSQQVNPPFMCDWSYAHGYRVEGNGSSHALIPAAARAFGLKAEGIGNNGQKIVDALSSGKLVVAIMGPYHFTRGGHYIVLRGVTKEGKILVADCGKLSRCNVQWDLSLILREARKGASAGGPFWVISR